MNEMHRLRPLWRALCESGEEFVLATVVTLEGSGYRKAGARMLIAQDGRRAGTISGGCLEAEVAKKAFWHTENGPAMRTYSTHAEDGDVPYGMGCGGVIHLLLERRETAAPLLEAMDQAYDLRLGLAVATQLSGAGVGRRCWQMEGDAGMAGSPDAQLQDELRAAAARRKSAGVDGVFAEWMGARTGLLIVGAGNDAQPLARAAHAMGWHVSVMDGRSNLITRERFPEADGLQLLTPAALDGLLLRPTDAVALMSHSLEQDRMALRSLLPRDLAYLGVLGPRSRTADMVAELAAEAAAGKGSAGRDAELAAAWMERLHAPMGLELGGDGAESVALSILAEMQQTLHGASGLPLRELRRNAGASDALAHGSVAVSRALTAS